ncbi:hypothetical protein dsx2_1509 [Desulfovibrio sp. X2]|uniref:phage regulatory CII family protein n=1 Tax=Desulfovibrio sp. X2 TaxID=941449 RepID=UPI000358AC2D|nr:phage regulatory CII family protein [Desulfovibrio sp. X2]EPR44550.1 hypothetical protein dsx2_1509 [Desulfovibrio sp. X2]
MRQAEVNHEFDYPRLRALIAAMVRGNPRRTPKELAAMLGKSYSTLCREINPHDSGAKLGLEDFVRLTQITRDYAPMRFVAVESGFLSVRHAGTEATGRGLSGDPLAMEVARQFFQTMERYLEMQAGGGRGEVRSAFLRTFEEFCHLALHWKQGIEESRR